MIDYTKVKMSQKMQILMNKVYEANVSSKGKSYIHSMHQSYHKKFCKKYDNKFGLEVSEQNKMRQSFNQPSIKPASKQSSNQSFHLEVADIFPQENIIYKSQVRAVSSSLFGTKSQMMKKKRPGEVEILQQQNQKKQREENQKERIKKLEKERLQQIEKERRQKIEKDRLQKIERERKEKIEKERLQKIEQQRLQNIEKERRRQEKKRENARLEKQRRKKQQQQMRIKKERQIEEQKQRQIARQHQKQRKLQQQRIKLEKAQKQRLQQMRKQEQEKKRKQLQNKLKNAKLQQQVQEQYQQVEDDSESYYARILQNDNPIPGQDSLTTKSQIKQPHKQVIQPNQTKSHIVQHKNIQPQPQAKDIQQSEELFQKQKKQQSNKQVKLNQIIEHSMVQVKPDIKNEKICQRSNYQPILAGLNDVVDHPIEDKIDQPVQKQQLLQTLLENQVAIKQAVEVNTGCQKQQKNNQDEYSSLSYIQQQSKSQGKIIQKSNIANENPNQSLFHENSDLKSSQAIKQQLANRTQLSSLAKQQDNEEYKENQVQPQQQILQKRIDKIVQQFIQSLTNQAAHCNRCQNIINQNEALHQQIIQLKTKNQQLVKQNQGITEKAKKNAIALDTKIIDLQKEIKELKQKLQSQQFYLVNPTTNKNIKRNNSQVGERSKVAKKKYNSDEQSIKNSSDLSNEQKEKRQSSSDEEKVQ